MLARLHRLLGAVAVDAGLLRRNDQLRRLLGAQAVSLAGSMVTFVALPLQAYALTGSTLTVGLLGIAEFVPLVALALVGGSLADVLDRRRMILRADLAAAAVCLGLLVNALLADPRLWVLFAGAALFAACDALRRPPLDALVPRLVAREDLKATFALTSIVFDVAQVAGPALGGVLIAVAGYEATYAVDLASFLVSAALVLRLRAIPAALDEATTPRGLRAGVLRVREGVRYARGRPELLGTYLVDVNAMLFAMPFALFPALAQRYGSASTAGLLYAAPAVGAVVASLTSGWTAHVHRHGRAVALAAAGWGVAIAAFGLAGPLWLALVFLAVAGAADGVSGLFRATIWNETIPDALRGRLAGLEMLSWSSGPALGNARAGAVAGLGSVRVAIWSGGVLCVAGTAGLVGLLPRFWAYDAREGPEATEAPPG